MKLRFYQGCSDDPYTYSMYFACRNIPGIREMYISTKHHSEKDYESLSYSLDEKEIYSFFLQLKYFLADESDMVVKDEAQSWDLEFWERTDEKKIKTLTVVFQPVRKDLRIDMLLEGKDKIDKEMTFKIQERYLYPLLYYISSSFHWEI